MRRNLPDGFADMLHTLGLDDLTDTLATSEPEVSVRLNPSKPGAEFEGSEPVAWCPGGLYLPQRPVFTLDPGLHQGLYYVQEASSMFHAHIISTLGLDRPVRVLDACAAPGGKTTAVASALPEGSVIVANEFVPARAAILKENIIKWGYPSAIVTRAATSAFSRLAGMFDIIVADVPCSGEGMMRKEPKAVEQWSPGLTSQCAALQWEIVSDLWPALAPGGWMIYSTCTFNRTENEDMLRRIADTFGAETIEVPADASWGITPALDPDLHACRFIPGRTRGEGLFAALIRKPGSADPSNRKTPKASRKGHRRDSGTDNTVATAARWILNPEAYTIRSTPERVWAFPTAHLDLLDAVARRADIIHEGIPLATLKGRDIIPAHALALSTALAPGVFPTVELDTPTALAYLRGEAVALPQGTPKGFVAPAHLGRPLGWMKNLGNRANNLYPAPYRIRI